jgi:hypothetical protein
MPQQLFLLLLLPLSLLMPLLPDAPVEVTMAFN